MAGCCTPSGAESLDTSYIQLSANLICIDSSPWRTTCNRQLYIRVCVRRLEGQGIISDIGTADCAAAVQVPGFNQSVGNC